MNSASDDGDDDDDDDDDDYDDVQVFLSHRSIYLLLFDLCQDLSATTTKPHLPMTSSTNHDVSRRIAISRSCIRNSGYRVLIGQ